jgi:hypothetical protein
MLRLKPRRHPIASAPEHDGADCSDDIIRLNKRLQRSRNQLDYLAVQAQRAALRRHMADFLFVSSPLAMKLCETLLQIA